MAVRVAARAVRAGVVAGILVGCAGPARRPPTPARGPVRVRPAQPEGGAVVRLVREAQRRGREGAWAAAGAALERALDLAPADPRLWHRLARVRLNQGQAGQARALAERSNALAGDDPGLRKRNWSLIAEACRAVGDRSCVRAAKERSKGP